MEEIIVTFPGGKRVDAEYKGFLMKTDQPVYSGGEGTAPAPFDLFLGSIATCAGYYVLAFCQSRGIPMEKASVRMSMTKSEGKKTIDTIRIEVELPPEFPEKYANAVIKSVDSCAVKIHMINPPAFEIVAKIQQPD
jgi:ribosomal protein S12 methylthiotransferase accessory factor